MVLKEVCVIHMDKLPCRKNTKEVCQTSSKRSDIILVTAEIDMRSKFGENYFK